MVSIEFLKGKKVLVFGIGVSGLATIYKLKKYVKHLSIWDDSSSSRKIVKKKLQLNLILNFIKLLMIL